MINVIKVGGAVVEKAEDLSAFLDAFVKVEGPKILVHGGGRLATTIAAQMGIPTQMVNGRRVTDAEMLKVVTMVYGGLVNKQIVAALQARGVNAVGLTGADLNYMLASKRPVIDGVDYGFAGDVEKTDGNMLAMLIERGILPVLSPLTHNGEGLMLNTNADTIASSIASSLAVLGQNICLTYCFEKPGVLKNPNDDNSVIEHINAPLFNQFLEDGTVSGGMIPKLQNAFSALKLGVKQVRITNTENLQGGTLVTLE